MLQSVLAGKPAWFVKWSRITVDDHRGNLANWETFISTHKLLPGVPPMIARSWERCWPRMSPDQQTELKHLSPNHLLSAQVQNFYLLSIARPIMEDIHQFIENSDSAIALANPAGYILDILGDQPMLDFARQAGITIGGLLSEAEMGTNAFSLSIRERFPATVVKAEHYRRQFHVFADYAAPIFDPTGKPLGTLGILTKAERYHPHGLGLVVAGARAIEAQRQSDLLLQEQNNQLLELNAILASISEGILAWNAEGILMHVNANAAQILGLPLQSLVGRPVDERFALPDYIQAALREEKTLTNVDAYVMVAGQPINCVISLRFGRIGQTTRWTILTLRQTEEVRELIQHQMGAQVSVLIDDLVGVSNQARRVRSLAKSAAAARASVLIQGETGTGKDYLARALHNASPRRNKPFLIISCSSVPNELVMGELLGFEQTDNERGIGGRPSKFELAHQGTLFFKDIEMLPLEAQATLLNILELGILQRLGSTRPIEVDVRILASTTADLENLVAQGSFRADLYYRLSTFEFVLPTLRERPEDIPYLIDHILHRLTVFQKRTIRLSDSALELLQKYPWPGNIRELEAVLERAAIQAGESEVISPQHLPPNIRQPGHLLARSGQVHHIPSLQTVEREALLHAAQACNGNFTQMAKLLGISRTTVWRKMKELNIPVERYRSR